MCISCDYITFMAICSQNSSVPFSEKAMTDKCYLFFQFPSAVKQGLDAQHLSSNARNEFNRIICSAISIHTMRPSPEEKNRVVNIVLAKYPFLNDNLGAGHVSSICIFSGYFLFC